MRRLLKNVGMVLVLAWVLAMNGALLIAIAGVFTAEAQDYTLLEAANGGAVGVCTTMDGEKVRCRKFNPRATPAPTARPTPQPTVAPLPCEPIGGTKTFAEGQPRMFCFSVADGPTILEVASTTPANVGCSDFESELTSPTGHKTYTAGAYPMGSDFRSPGRWYFWVNPLHIGAGLCNTYSFTVR